MPKLRKVAGRALIGLGAVAALLVSAFLILYATTPSVDRFGRENPKSTALIEQRRAEAKAHRRSFKPQRTWMALPRVSPWLVTAVIRSEDAAFWAHSGFDWQELRAAASQGLARGRLGRGASTISQQLAKNLFLGTERSLWRKAREAVLTVKLERALPKKRILALYLNVAEWGEGVFGAEAGARHWFGLSAADVDAAQAAVLASMLPAPRRASLAAPPRGLARHARRLLDRMLAAGDLDATEHAAASAELERILSGPGGDQEEEPPEEEPPVRPAAESEASDQPPTSPPGSPPAN